ncbi:hypothetical protein LC087_18460 [Bacillus carboniphilus]|uniref:Branched-chain amino acid ABC transporter substrate-binding protein n=1 Tax=Bacillus carboniphilus TaxID=86663 RepID=A0ABY9JYH7_9BACI|nr:hypothetical protein [Bacillus carboniphilus]WLR42635.1 hypothetical protein LC087_18460 [Bacillus carboniphilus]
MQKIKDERLVLKNLKNIRLLFGIQTAGIIGILGYDFMTKGVEGMTDNPLWVLFIITSIISAYLSMSITVDQEKKKVDSKKHLTLSILFILFVSTVIGLYAFITNGIMNGFILGGVVLICGLAPVIYLYYLRTKNAVE